MTHAPTSMDFLIAAEADAGRSAQEEFLDHVRAYRTFVKYALLFAAHVAVILALLAYFFT